MTSEILGGAVYNTNQMNISNTSFNTTTATANINAEGNSGVTKANATVLGGALYNSGNLTISNESSFTDNSAIAQGTSNNLTLTAQGGALYNSGTANISGTTFSNNSVTATGGTAQGGAIYNAAKAVINISNSTFSGNTANGAANDIYFAQNSTMNVQQGNVTINSGLASDGNTAAINIKYGGNLVVADNNSADYTGRVNIEGYGKLTFASQTAPSLENAIIKVTENYGSVEYKIGSDFTMTENNVTLADGVTNAEIIKSGSNTMTINGVFSDFSGQVSVAEGILKYIADDANDKYYNANSTKVHGGATLIFDIANATGGGVLAQSLSGLGSQPNGSGSGTFIKQGDGTLYMTGYNTEFVGNVTVNAGTLAFDSAQGASSYSFFGSDADITINQSGILYSNIDMAVNGNLKGDGTFKADNINLSVNGDNSGLANFIQTGGETTVESGGSLFKNNNITDGKVIFNANSSLADGSTFTTSNSVVEILNNSDANSIIGAVNNGTNSGLDLVLNNSNTTADLNIDGTNIETLTTQGNVTYGGILSGAGTVTNEGTLVIDGDASDFTGDFIQNAIQGAATSPSATVDETGKVFGGNKYVNAGSLNITSGSVDYENVYLASNTQLNHTSTGVNPNSAISESVVNFIDGAAGATATFNNGDYTLAGAVDNGNANRVVFNNSDVILGDVTNFTGGTTYVLQNSDLDLSADGALKDYSFSNLETDGVVKIDINAEFVDEGSTAAQGYMNTDTLYVGNDGGNTAEFQIGNIFIGGRETGSRRYDTKKDVLDGNAQFDSDTSSGNVQLIGATTSYEYSVGITDGITDDLKSIFLETTGMTDNNTLYEMNKTSGGRFFQFSVGNTDEYHIDKSLSATAEGVFNVTVSLILQQVLILN